MLAKLIEFLRRIGVISVGAGGYAGDAASRPVSMQDGDGGLQQLDRESRKAGR